MKPSPGTALITGGAKRIGKAIALSLAEQGYKIALHYNHSQNDAEMTAASIKKMKGACELFPCDLTNEYETSCLIKDVFKQFPDLNVLINNASVFDKSTLRLADLNSFNKNFAVHVKAPLALTRDFANTVKQGSVINMLDTNIASHKTPHFLYLLSKKTLAELTKMSALELAPNIRVNGIAPGAVLPPAGADETYLKERTRTVPLKNKSELNDIVRSILFLLNSPSVTGQIIFNDGGEHLV